MKQVKLLVTDREKRLLSLLINEKNVPMKTILKIYTQNEVMNVYELINLHLEMRTK